MHRPGASWVWRAGLAAVGVIVVVGALVGVGLQVAGPDGPPAQASGGLESGGPESPVARTEADARAADEDLTLDRTDPEGAAAELTRRRAALVSGERSVEEVSLPGSAAYEADTEFVEQAERSGTTVTGAELTVTSTREERRNAEGTAEVVVEYVVGPHEQVAQDGSSVQVAAGDPQTATLVLAWTPDGWRATDVL